MRQFFMIVLLIAANTATALGVVHNQYSKRVIGMQMHAQEKEHDHAIDKWSQLLVEYATWSSNSRVEKIARERLGMHYEYRDFIVLRVK